MALSKWLTCDNIEKLSPDDAGFTCECAPGYMDEETPCEAGDTSCFHNCVNINECGDATHEDISGCSQICNDTEGSFYCSCQSGYILDLDDNKTCWW